MLRPRLDLDATVAVCLQRMPALVVALLGILFAGGDGVGFLGWEVVTSYIYLYMFIIVIILFPI